MRMKNLSNFFIGMLAMCTLAGCSDNELGNDPDVNTGTSKDAVYLSVKVQLPTGAGTRSQTESGGGSNSGTEEGQPNENKVVSVLLVLAKKDNTLIGCAEKTEGTPQEKDGKITAVQSISKSKLGAYYGDDKQLTPEEQTIRVFVFCNPTDALKRIFAGVSAGNATWYNQICTISEAPNGECDNAAIWGGDSHQNGFLMSSFEIAEKKLPKNFADWDSFTTAGNPFRLTGTNLNIPSGDEGKIENGDPIKVERSVARFDFRDGSKKDDGTANDNTYDVIYDDPEKKTNCLVKIKLEKMALVNMSKNFYYLRRVSDDGLDTNSKLCSKEINSNYVVDTDANEKNDESIITNKTFSNHFNFCLGHTKEDGTYTIDETARGQWSTSLISDVLTNGEDDEDDTWNSDKTKGDYKIWRYVTENTIPGDASNQKQGISTGIVFKGKMIATDYDKNSDLYKALTNNKELTTSDPILYAYGSDLYVRWTEVRAMAIKQGANSPMYKAVFGNTTIEPVAGEENGTGAVYSTDTNSPDAKWNAWYNDETVTDDNRDPIKLATFKASATKEAGFTLYERSYDSDTKSYGYYCYYYYWNRHNDNGNNGVMRTMEFAVVRNNVYKLAVNSISKLGHPRISDNDPDPVDPEDPDEDGDVYISVSVEVLPWVVRINNIDF